MISEGFDKYRDSLYMKVEEKNQNLSKFSESENEKTKNLESKRKTLINGIHEQNLVLQGEENQ